MAILNLPLNLESLKKSREEYEILHKAQKARESIADFITDERYMDALERAISIMRDMREYPDFSHPEFRTLLAGILFDLAEIHFFLKDYKQSEKELETLFKVIGRLVKEDPERFGEFHVLAMELAARILRSRKKVVETLRKEKLNTNALYEKVNAGITSATDRLVDSLRKVGELVAATGAYKEALRFYAEAIKFSKKRSGRVGRKEIKMTIEMAEIMSRIKSMRPRAKRLLGAVLPHSIALETIELEENIRALIEMIDSFEESPSKWKTFIHSITLLNRKKETSEEEKALKEKKKALKKDIEDIKKREKSLKKEHKRLKEKKEVKKAEKQELSEEEKALKKQKKAEKKARKRAEKGGEPEGDKADS